MPTIINSDTVWHGGSTYYLTDKVQIAPGATLTIEAGAVVDGGFGQTIETFGTLNVLGTSADKVELDKVRLIFGGNSLTPGRMNIDHAVVEESYFLPPTGNGSYGSFYVSNSVFIESGLKGQSSSDEYQYIWYPTSESTFANNLFYNMNVFSVGTSGVDVKFTQNTFMSSGISGSSIQNWASYGSTHVIAYDNSFLGSNPSLEVAMGYSSSSINGENNWFGTSDPAVIATKILDRSDDLNRASFIDYQPTMPESDAFAKSHVAVGDDNNESLRGTDKNDWVFASGGNDFLYGGSGFDVLDGASGLDTAAFGNLTRSYNVVLGARAGSVSGGSEGTNSTLLSIENVNFLDSTLTFDPNSDAAYVMRLYDSTLDREPDALGLDYWLDQMDAGVSKSSVANAFLQSPEFARAAGTLSTGGFVDFLYAEALGRPSDAGGKSYWVGQIDGGMSRGDALLNFSESTEHRAQTADILAKGLWITDDNYQAITALYDTFSNRLPDEGGLGYWVGKLQSGMSLSQIADGFAHSSEFATATSGFSNGDLVDFMYENTLNRTADAGGRANWVSQLDAGLGKGDLLVGFSDSAEHYNLIGSHLFAGVDYYPMM